LKIDFNGSELNRLVADLAEVPAGAHRRVVQAVKYTAHGIRDFARGAVSGLAHAPHYPQAITYDVDDLGEAKGVTAEIGPEHERRQGSLGNILEYGTIKNPPYAHLGPGLDHWTPDLQQGLEKAAADALEAL